MATKTFQTSHRITKGKNKGKSVVSTGYTGGKGSGKSAVIHSFPGGVRKVVTTEWKKAGRR